MKKPSQCIGLKDVQSVYGGAEGDLWELLMGEQIHLGGLQSSLELAERVDIKSGSNGVDLCCCNGAGMRFLLHFRQTAHMTGVDATKKVLEQAKFRCEAAGFGDRITLVESDVCQTGLPNNYADFVWGEDAWCYVADKGQLIKEAARILKSGGKIAFTDWIEGPAGLSDAEADRFCTFMKFPNILNMNEYSDLLQGNGCKILAAEYTERFAPCMDLYLDMASKQLTYDILKIIGFNQSLFEQIAGEMFFIQELAHEKKIIQGLFVAQKL